MWTIFALFDKTAAATKKKPRRCLKWDNIAFFCNLFNISSLRMLRASIYWQQYWCRCYGVTCACLWVCARVCVCLEEAGGGICFCNVLFFHLHPSICDCPVKELFFSFYFFLFFYLMRFWFKIETATQRQSKERSQQKSKCVVGK